MKTHNMKGYPDMHNPHFKFHVQILFRDSLSIELNYASIFAHT